MAGKADIDGLDAHLRARVTALSDRGVCSDRDFVLCWLHHAVRGHENPVLDVAVHLGNTIGKPVLVYQGLGGRHRFNSDRHHRFIMEGARELAGELAGRGIAYAFHLPADPLAPSPMGALLGRACALVCEDFPAPPFPDWTRRWADRAPCAAFAVDGACLMPLRSLGERCTRAFKFRDKAKGAWRELIHRAWGDVSAEVDPIDLASIGEEDLGFHPLSLEDADLDELCARCNIDHSIPPVGRIRGGSAAGYTRWEAFKHEHLARYDRRRNDAADMDAVSGLSPWLHHGHVSVFRIAREAASAGGKGAEKFLDELLVWRELAFNFCAHTGSDQLETLRALPDWAQRTLETHAGDPREAELTWERLSRGRSGSALWDQMQRSLVRNGELHNNARMTWGKSIAGWTKNPDEALRTLIDLNHRYALDGNDPNSYGGLLWCLGQFDRAFTPERPVLGSVRGRDVGEHAERLDVRRYARAIDARLGHRSLRVGVIGAGVSGLACARTLSDHGVDVVVLDRGRRAGGRLSTRRPRAGDGPSFDHGAPVFDVTDARFGRYVRSWLDDGICSRWEASCALWDGTALEHVPPERPQLVGTGGMARICEHLASELDVRTGQVVAQLERDGACWSILDESGGSLLSDVDAVVLAMAPEQAARLVAWTDGPVPRGLAHLASRTVWAGMVVARLGDEVPDLVRLEVGGPIERVVRNERKPGWTSPPGEAWLTVHMRPAWSAERRESAADRVAVEIGDALERWFQQVAPGATIHSCEAHRWGLAGPERMCADATLFDRGRGVAVCGDGFAGRGVEAAFLSGHAAAGRVLSLRPARVVSDGMAESSDPGLFSGGEA